MNILFDLGLILVKRHSTEHHHLHSFETSISHLISLNKFSSIKAKLKLRQPEPSSRTCLKQELDAIVIFVLTIISVFSIVSICTPRKIIHFERLRHFCKSDLENKMMNMMVSLRKLSYLYNAFFLTETRPNKKHL